MAFVRRCLCCRPLPLHQQRKVVRTLQTVSLIIFGLVLMNMINALLISGMIVFQESTAESDYDFDTRPFYRLIETKKRFDSSGDYLIVRNFLHYQSNLTKSAHLLALTLHSSIEHLPLLLEHSQRWDGPISISLYIKGQRASDDLDYASIWFHCHRRTFQMLDVHLVISAKAYQGKYSSH
jgi:hypothetical protein